MPSTVQLQARSLTLQSLYARRYQSEHQNQHQAGFVLVLCLIITPIVSLGSIALIRYSNSQTQMVSMSGFQTLLRAEAGWIAQQVVHELQSEKQLNGVAAVNDAANNQCNQLPNGVDSIKVCVEMPTTCTASAAGCHAMELTEPTAESNSDSGPSTASNINLYAGKTIKLYYLGEMPAQGTADDNHHLYRIDVTLKLNDWSITERQLVKLDRIGRVGA
jgi:Tfp pilus assembly protein PilX